MPQIFGSFRSQHNGTTSIFGTYIFLDNLHGVEYWKDWCQQCDLEYIDVCED